MTPRPPTLPPRELSHVLLVLSRSLTLSRCPDVSCGFERSNLCGWSSSPPDAWTVARVASLDTNATRAVDSDGNSSGIRRIEKRYLRLNVYIRNPSRTSGLLTRRKRSPIQPCALRGAALPSRLPLSTPRRLFRRASRVDRQRIGVENRPEVERNVVERHVRARVVVASRRATANESNSNRARFDTIRNIERFVVIVRARRIGRRRID